MSPAQPLRTTVDRGTRDACDRRVPDDGERESRPVGERESPLVDEREPLEVRQRQASGVVERAQPNDRACNGPSPGECRAGSDLDDVPSLVAWLLDQQQQVAVPARAGLSAVEQFARDQIEEPAPRDVHPSPRQALYRRALPAAPPGPGQQYGFEVDLDRCSGCKACVTACHSLNGLDEGEVWRDVGLLLGGSRSAPVMQHVTTACHHCLAPACLTACPVNAYEKDPATGIVVHLDDQCFGCRYCTLACPYDVPKYHAEKGIVRKCDMCSSRFAVGEPPACVQSCPHEAIAIRVVDVSAVIEDAEAAPFLPGAPDPQITYPTTNFKSRRAWPRNMLPADYFELRTEHPHWPLVLMLVLTQLSVGAFAVGLWLDHGSAGPRPTAVQPLHGATALVFGLVALAASIFHLGRPQYAYRAVLGLGHSWLSREIVAFGVFAVLACAYAAAVAMPTALGASGAAVARGLGWSVVGVGAGAIVCSIMIYASLGIEFWSVGRTTLRFALTAALLGTATAWLSIALLAALDPSETAAALADDEGPRLLRMLITVAGFKMGWEAALVRHRWSRAMTPLKRSALLMTRELASGTLARFAAGLLGGVLLPAILIGRLSATAATTVAATTTTAAATSAATATATTAAATSAAHTATSATAIATAVAVNDPIVANNSVALVALSLLLFGMCLVGELCERYQFFAAMAAPRMPGRIR